MQIKKPRTSSEFILFFIEAMTLLPEFRNLFYMRMGRKSWPFRWMCQRLRSLDIVSPSIGPGLFIQHGDNTFVTAESIGENCSIGRHVVVGYSNLTDRPTIGNNVRIQPGAKIIGKIKLGDNSVIGLNTVVIDNVEPNVTVLGVPAKVVWRSSAKTPS
jgi:serine O-acetyltransferase